MNSLIPIDVIEKLIKNNPDINADQLIHRAIRLEVIDQVLLLLLTKNKRGIDKLHEEITALPNDLYKYLNDIDIKIDSGILIDLGVDLVLLDKQLTNALKYEHKEQLFELNCRLIHAEDHLWIALALTDNNEHEKEIIMMDTKIEIATLSCECKQYLTNHSVPNEVRYCLLETLENLNKTYEISKSLYVHADKISSSVKKYIENLGIVIHEI